MERVTKDSASSLIIQGFTVIQAKGNESCKHSHCLYLKPHTSELQSGQWPKGRTLQVHNIPPYCNEKNLKLIFSNCGEIKKIFIQEKPSSVPQSQSSCTSSLVLASSIKNYKVAYIVFKKEEGLKKACNIPYDKVWLLSNADIPLCNVGVAAYIKEYQDSIIDLTKLEKGTNDFLVEYYKNHDENLEREKSMEGVPDEDGFIKVTRHGRIKGAKRTEESEKRGRERHRQRKIQNELKDFYKFQFRESKRQHIAELQSKFEEDKRRVQEMKAARKFRPVA